MSTKTKTNVMADAYKDMFSDKVFQDLINFHPFTIDDFLAF